MVCQNERKADPILDARTWLADLDLEACVRSRLDPGVFQGFVRTYELAILGVGLAGSSDRNRCPACKQKEEEARRS